MIGKIGKLKSISYKSLEPKFHYSLVDYWDFSKYSNTDTTHNIIGLNGNELIPFNFSYTLSSGYGKYEINYLSFDNIASEYEGNRTQSYFHLVKKLSTDSIFVFAKISSNPNSGTFTMPSYNIRITGLKENEKFLINLIKNTGEGSEISYLLEANKDGEYSVPSVSMEYLEGETIAYNYTLKDINNSNLNVLIEQLPQYQGAIVLDGIDDELLFTKTGYKIGTIILRHIPISTTNWGFIFDIQNERRFIGYENTISNISANFDNKTVDGDYTIFRNNNPTQAISESTIGCMKRDSITNHMAFALYDFAIFENVLTDKEVQKQIDIMNDYQICSDYSFDKSNSDDDISRVYNKLNSSEFIQLNNFAFRLNSGYGLFKENYQTYKTVFPVSQSGFVIRDFIPSNTFVVYKYDTDPIKATKVRVTGLTAPNQFTYEYSPSDGGSRVIFPIPEDGEYDLPESIQKSSGDPGYNVGFAVRGVLTKNVTIEQIPEYPNHLVFDGVDDYTSPIPNFNVNEGTIIIQYNPIDTDAVKMLSNGALGTFYSHTFFIGNISIQSRGADSTTRVEIPINAENTISAFAYNSTGINIFSNGIFKTSNHINNKYQYAFGKDWNSAKYSKLALKRVKIFNKKLTENQIKKEYNLLLNEI